MHILSFVLLLLLILLEAGEYVVVPGILLWGVEPGI
jgi:hypothetical protein